MKTKFCFTCMLLMAVVFFSCNKDDEKAKLENHLMVDEVKLPLQGMMFSYDKTSKALAEGKARGSYPLDLYLYAHKPYFENGNEESMVIADSAPMILFKLYSSENGIPDTGDYSWNISDTDAGTCTGAWQCTKKLPMQTWFELNDGRSVVMIPQYEQVDISVSSLRVNKLEDGFYEFFFEGIDNKGAKISGYFKGDYPIQYIVESQAK